MNDTGLPGSIARVVEYYHKVLDNYFSTADPVEQAAVGAGAAGTRTHAVIIAVDNIRRLRS